MHEIYLENTSLYKERFGTKHLYTVKHFGQTYLLIQRSGDFICIEGDILNKHIFNKSGFGKYLFTKGEGRQTHV